MDQLFPQAPLPPELAYEFMGIFARFEYALKCSAFAKGNAKSVDADWDKYATAIDWHFRRIKDKAFVNAVHFLLTDSPRKQVIQNGHVAWQKSPPDPKLPKAQQTLLMVRRIRNNMFHGAKVWTPEYENRERDIKFVKSGLVVLKQCAPIIDHVRYAFDFGRF